MRALLERPNELAEVARRSRDEPLLARDGREGEEAPAQAVRQGLRVAFDEAVVGKHPERAGDLALLAAHELCDTRYPELAALAEDEQDRESAFQARCRFGGHLHIMATAVVG